MGRMMLFVVILWIVAATLLGGCTDGRSQPAPDAIEGTAVGPPAPLQPDDILLQLDWEGGFSRQEESLPFGRVPEFTLLASGNLYYLDEGEPLASDLQQLLQPRATPAGAELLAQLVLHMQLAPAEAHALVQQVLDLGFERLESYTNWCEQLADGTSRCADASRYSILRVRLPDGELREARNWTEAANDPEALLAIRQMLTDYDHPQAEPYLPQRASLFVRPFRAESLVTAQEWPLDPAWLRPPEVTTAEWASILSGEDLDRLLAVGAGNMGSCLFQHVGQAYEIYLVPWLPGADYTQAVASYSVPLLPEELVPPDLPTAVVSCPQASTAGLPSRLVIEEHPLQVGPVAVGFVTEDFPPGFRAYFETADGDTPEIVARREAYRDSAGLLAEANNTLLEPFGYRLVSVGCPNPYGVGDYQLLRDGEPYGDRMSQFSPVSVNASGTRFVMAAAGRLLTQRGLGGEYQGEVYVGEKLLRLVLVDKVLVYLDDKLIYWTPIFLNRQAYEIPIQSREAPLTNPGPWTYDGHWVLELGVVFDENTPPSSGRIIQDGADLNEACGYEESFNFALLEGRPFYFFRREGQVGIVYDGRELLTGYDEVPHYEPWPKAVLNPGYSRNMVWFFASREGQQYYVEVYVPPATSPVSSRCPTPTPAPTVTPVPTPMAVPGMPVAGDPRTRAKDGMIMLYVPAGLFPMGSPYDSGGGFGEQPVHTVYLDAFWMDRTEVSNGQYLACVEAGVCQVAGTIEYEPEAKPDHPAIVVWNDAHAYCEWAGGRLPTEAEWEKAARGTSLRKYPWGEAKPDCSRANFQRIDGFCIGGTAPVGSYPTGASPYGVLDMAGNVAEWVSDRFVWDYYAHSPDRNPQGPDEAAGGPVDRGGSWESIPPALRCASRGTSGAAAWAGFRCVVPAQPGP